MMSAPNPFNIRDDAPHLRGETAAGVAVPVVLESSLAVRESPQPRLSVIVVSYNAGEFLDNCVKAVLGSSIPLQLVVCDNASDDGSIERLERCWGGDERLLVLRNPTNLGFAKANNRAVKHARAEFVVLLNPDCFVGVDTLERLCQTMVSNPDAGMVGCMVRNPDGTEQAGTRRSIPTPWRTLVRIFHLDALFPSHPKFRNFVISDEPLPDSPVPMEGISGALMLVRRSALERVGPLDEGYFLHCEDLDWFMRFRADGWGILFVPDVEVTHLKGGCSKRHPLRVLWHKHRGMVRFYQKFFRHQYPRPLMWSVAAAVWTRFSVMAVGTVLRTSASQARCWMANLRQVA